MYTVIFRRTNNEPDEIYYYNEYKDALYHYNLFKNDNDPDYKDMYISMELNIEKRVFSLKIDSFIFK